MSILISIEKLLSGNFVEGTRMEFKEGWNPKTMKRVLNINGSPKPIFDTN